MKAAAVNHLLMRRPSKGCNSRKMFGHFDISYDLLGSVNNPGPIPFLLLEGGRLTIVEVNYTPRG